MHRDIGYLPEQPYFYDYLTATELLDYFARFHDFPANDRRERVVAGIADKAVMGSAEQVLDELARLVEAGASTVACRIRFDSTDSARVTENMERLAADVLPHLRSAAA